MTIDVANAVAGLGIRASDHQQVFHHVNKTPGIAFFTANGTWSVPEGVHAFRVTLYGAGGCGDGVLSGDSFIAVSGNPGDRVRTYFTGVDIGTTFSITVGAGQVHTGGAGAGGVTSFGANFRAAGGGGATGGSSALPTAFPSGAIQLFVFPEYRISGNRPYGDAGYGSPLYAPTGAENGLPGLVIVEW